MTFRDLPIKSEYRSRIDNIVGDFYLPILSESVLYKRAVGFFSSTALVNISRGITKLVENGGKIQLVASPSLSDEDVTAIKVGYADRHKIIENALLTSLTEAKNRFEEERLNLLANLIAQGIMDIKIAIVNDSSIGIFHEKMGLMYGTNGDVIAFSGSMNESNMAFAKNYEAIDIYCSWTKDADRVKTKEAAFTAVWGNCEPGIEVFDFPNVKDELLKRYKRNDFPNMNIDDEEACAYKEDDNRIDERSERMGAIAPDWLLAAWQGDYKYQADAVCEWERENYCGIFDMATGTGKTLTGLGAVARLSEHLSDKLAVFIVCPYQHLVEQWLEDIKQFNMQPIIGYSASIQKDWKERLADAVRDQKLKVRNREFFCFISTNATFASEYVQSQIQKLKGNALLLALSATLDRHNDEEGTAALYNYFGRKCIEYTLDRAIDEHKLTRYKYYPIVVTLNDIEISQYLHLSYEIGKCLIKGRNGKLKLSEKGKRLALARARVVAGAENKIDALNELIQPYKNDNHILVYCGATKLLRENQDITGVDEDDIRQIDAVTDLLGNRLNMKVSQFTSKEDVAEREILKREFSDGQNLQALIAIKCLDEGVNIPRIKTAFILASTTNPKEYIQRRGRVLRLSPGKDFAEIYDFLTLPRPTDEVSSLTVEQMKQEQTLVKNEIIRAEEFARLAMNVMEAESVIDDVKAAYGINDNTYKFGEGEFYDGE